MASVFVAFLSRRLAPFSAALELACRRTGSLSRLTSLLLGDTNWLGDEPFARWRAGRV